MDGYIYIYMEFRPFERIIFRLGGMRTTREEVEKSRGRRKTEKIKK